MARRSASLIARLADRASAASPVFARSALATGRLDDRAIFGPLAGEAFALGLETIYEAYLVHYGTPRAFRPRDRESAILLGDYLYATGLVLVTEAGDVEAVNALADLIGAATHLRAEAAADDGLLWLATARFLAGARDVALAPAVAALRDGDPAPLAALARRGGDAPAALALHAELATAPPAADRDVG
jgi:hypothetical protein